MKGLKINVRGSLLLLILILLIVPLIQNKFEFIKLTPLNGAIINTEKHFFSIHGWISGEYQINEEKYLNETFGFRNFFVRLNNQLAFNLFNKAKANGVIVGKNNYLFEENYIKAYFGSDFIGIDSITHRIQKLKFIQDTLSKLHKNIIIVFAAGKGSYYHEYFPDKLVIKKGATNYEYYVLLAKKYGIKYIDFNKYFVENKYKSKYPLYPKYGIHWSFYGTCLAADSIIHYIENLRHIRMSRYFWNKVEIDDPKITDYDIADGMNLLCRLKCQKMAYPQLQLESDSGKVKPSVLVIADSYYWAMYSFIPNTFSLSHFWFYNKQIYPESVQNPLETSQIILKDEIAKHDVIIIMATEATLPGLGWGFIESTYKLFRGIIDENVASVEFQKKVANLKNYIKTDKNWMNAIIEKAKANKVSIDSMITLDAIWQIQHAKNN